MNFIKKIVSPFTRCWHLKRGPIITCRPGYRPSAVASITGTYCVCLQCGKHFAYDWEQMRFIDPEPENMQPIPAQAADGVFARKPG